MPKKISAPTVIEAAGNKPKRIEEVIGRVNTGDEHISIAHMRSPEGWVEPGQRPDFEELTYVLKGMVWVEFESGAFKVRAGEAIVSQPDEWVRYSTPEPGGAEYIAVCLPAFGPGLVRRDEE